MSEMAHFHVFTVKLLVGHTAVVCTRLTAGGTAPCAFEPMVSFNVVDPHHSVQLRLAIGSRPRYYLALFSTRPLNIASFIMVRL